MKLPSKIKVGCYEIDVIPMKSLEGFSHGVYGHFSQSEMCIRIITDLSPVVVMNTLVHELMHVCYFVGGLDDADDEERVVNTLANQYCGILVDNPEFNKFIQRCCKCK